MDKSRRKISIFLSVLLFVSLCTFGVIAYAQQKPTIVLFYTNWNVQCRVARQVVPNVANSYNGNVNYIELDVDQPSTADAAISMNLPIPDNTPYIYVVNKKSKIVTQMQYNKESVKELKDCLKKKNLPLLIGIAPWLDAYISRVLNPVRKEV